MVVDVGSLGELNAPHPVSSRAVASDAVAPATVKRVLVIVLPGGGWASRVISHT